MFFGLANHLPALRIGGSGDIPEPVLAEKASALTVPDLAAQDGLLRRFLLGPVATGSIHGLQMLNPAVQAAVSFHENVSNASNFIDYDIATHESRLLTIWPRRAFGIDSGETSSGARNEN